MMMFLFAIVVGFASHFGLYDLCRTLPFPDLTSHVCGVLCTYPIAKAMFKERDDFDYSFLISFLGVGIGVFCARIVRGLLKMKSNSVNS